MESSSAAGARLRVACDRCTAAAWIGAVGAPNGGYDAWCEACQSATRLPGASPGARCPNCRTPLTTGAPRFPEIWGELQNLDAVLAAWAGEPDRLATLLPERPAFVSDLTPPAARASDPAEVRALLASVARGDYAAALTSLVANDADDPRTHAARAIALERRGDSAGALVAWTHALAHREWPQARLSRGAIRARAGEFAAAGEDFALAGAGEAARWNRAALIVTRAVRDSPGRPDAAAITAAGLEAGEASAYWSDPTVGRRAWTLLGARALAAKAAGGFRAEDGDVLRDSEAFFEHDTFWDRAMILATWSRLGSAVDAERIAQPLARGQVAALLAEPALTGAPLADAAAKLARAHDAIDARQPAAARELLAPLLADPTLRRYRLPCVACGSGSVGIEWWDDASGEPGE